MPRLKFDGLYKAFFKSMLIVGLGISFFESTRLYADMGKPDPTVDPGFSPIRLTLQPFNQEPLPLLDEPEFVVDELSEPIIYETGFPSKEDSLSRAVHAAATLNEKVVTTSTPDKSECLEKSSVEKRNIARAVIDTGKKVGTSIYNRGREVVQRIADIGTQTGQAIVNKGRQVAGYLKAKFSATAQRVASAARKMLGHVNHHDIPSIGLVRGNKCAQQASDILDLAKVKGVKSYAVVGVVDKLKAKGWSVSSYPMPGAIAFSNPRYEGTGKRSHIGVVSFSTGRANNAGSRYVYTDPETNKTSPLTIFHNSGRTIVEGPRGEYDRKWFANVLFMLPPDAVGSHI